MPVEQVPYTDSFPVKIYQPKNAIPAGWFWLGHSADGSHALIVKPTLPRKTGRNYALVNGKSGVGELSGARFSLRGDCANVSFRHIEPAATGFASL